MQGSSPCEVKDPACMVGTRIFQRPFGVPRDMTMSEYTRNPICTLSPYNYKVEASLLLDKTEHPCLCVLDTGAGPNLIRAGHLPEHMLSKLERDRKVVNLRSASNHAMEILGIIHLTIKVGEYSCRQPFAVSKTLTSDVILGATFIDAHVENIWVRQRKVILCDGSELPIERRAAWFRPTGLRMSEPLPVKVQPPRLVARLSERVKIDSFNERVVEVLIPKKGTFLIEMHPRLYERHQVSLATGVVTVKDPTLPVKVKLANFSPQTRELPKNCKVGDVIAAPNTVHEVTFGPDGPEVKELALLSTSEDSSKVPAGAPKSMAPLTAVNYDYRNPICGMEAKQQSNPDQILPADHAYTVDDLNLDHLLQEQQAKVRETLRPFSDMWSGKLGKIKLTKHRIELKEGAQPFRCQPYRAGPAMREIENQQVTEMLRDGVIEPSNSEFAGPVLLVPKPDGSKRFAIDYRRLNEMTVKDQYPLPRMDEYLDSLGEAKWFTTLDANSGYWQVEIHPDDIHKTSFVCHSGTYQFLRMPFGLTNAPATFQRLMDIALNKFKWQNCLVYLDDIVIYSNTFDDHCRDVAQILEVLQQAGVSLKLKKCSFFTDNIQYLGHVVRPGQLAVAEKTITAVKQFRIPETQTQLWSFLGPCNVYRRFVPNFS